MFTSVIAGLLWLATLTKMLLEKEEKAVKEVIDCVDTVLETVVDSILPHDVADDPISLILSMESLGANVTERYDVVTNPDGSTYYGYIVNVTFDFPDNTVAHHEFLGNNLLSVLQDAINWLVQTIQYWKSQNPGY